MDKNILQYKVTIAWWVLSFFPIFIKRLLANWNSSLSLKGFPKDELRFNVVVFFKFVYYFSHWVLINQIFKFNLHYIYYVFQMSFTAIEEF